MHFEMCSFATIIPFNISYICFVGDFMSLTHYMVYHHQPPVFSRERQKPTFCYHIRVANSVVWHYLTVMSLVADVNAMTCRCCVQKCAAHITADS